MSCWPCPECLSTNEHSWYHEAHGSVTTRLQNVFHSLRVRHSRLVCSIATLCRARAHAHDAEWGHDQCLSFRSTARTHSISHEDCFAQSPCFHILGGLFAVLLPCSLADWAAHCAATAGDPTWPRLSRRGNFCCRHACVLVCYLTGLTFCKRRSTKTSPLWELFGSLSAANFTSPARSWDSFASKFRLPTMDRGAARRSGTAAGSPFVVDVKVRQS